MLPPLPTNEEERLAQLRSYQILDSGTEQDFDDLVELASSICRTPVSLISLVDRDRQWFKAKKGTTETGTGKDISFCAHTVFSGQDLIISDAREDERFKNNPLVTGDPHIVFYAGIPLTNSAGFTLGSICVLDQTTRQLSSEQHSALKIIARQVMDKLELRKKILDLEEARKKIGRLNNSLNLSEEKAAYMIKCAPVAIGVLSGRNLLIESANDQLLEIWGKTEDVIGRKLEDALPELQGQPFPSLLDGVYLSGIPYSGTETPVSLVRNGVPGTYYFNFVYQPLKDATGVTRSIMVVANEVTEQVRMRKDLEFSEYRATRMVMTSTVGMTILRGRDLVVEIANDPMLRIWQRKPEEIIGKKLMDVFPELVGQPYPKLLGDIFDTHKPVAIKEIVAEIADISGKINKVTIDISYEPLHDVDGSVSGIMATVKDITDIVSARTQLEMSEVTLQQLNDELTAANEEQAASNEELLSSYENLDKLRADLVLSENRLRLAVEITDLATTDVDLHSGTMFCNERYAEMFGFGSSRQLTLQESFARIHEQDYLEVVEPAMRSGIKTGEFGYDVRVHLDEMPLKWIRVKGRILSNQDDEPVRLISTAVDITELKDDEQRKHDFIAIVSHELKTPLTSAKAYLQLSNRQINLGNSEQVAIMLDKTLLQLDKMEGMIRGFLDVTRLESGKLHLDITPFSIGDLIREVIRDHIQLNRRHQFNLHIDRELNIDADRNKISQVIENLVGNAVKYAPESTKIDIYCAASDRQVTISVKDYGPGIKKEDQQRLFDRFYRVENAVSKSIVGFGIGLYLCAEIVKRHNGRLSVESDYGHGATFSFTLPIH